MSIRWPSSLVPELAERRCVVVFGTGASASCLGADGTTRPPTWKPLLIEASNLLTEEADRDIVRKLVETDRLLDAAEIVVAKVNPPDFSEFIRKVFVAPRFAHSPVHEQIYHLDPKVLVTTNYDDIYESYCKQGKGSRAYNVCRYYESHAVNDVRSTMRLILKAHGCVSDPQRVILARTQYHRGRRDYPQYFGLLDSLFVTHTTLFIGCSLTDPDFLLMLEEANIRCPSEHPHYAVIEAGQPQPLRTALREVYNVESLEFSQGQYDEVVTGLKELNSKVDEWRRTHA